MARVRVRYWAAARAAAGVVEETLDGERLADVVAAARAAHGDELGRVLDQCAFLVDEVRARPDTPLADGSIVEVLPPFAGGARAGGAGGAGSAGTGLRADVGGRAAAVGAGTCVGLAALCLLGAAAGPVVLAAAVLVVQGLFLAGWPAVTGARGAVGATVLAGAAAAAVDVLLLTRNSEPAVGPVAWVLGPLLLLAFLAQLLRRDGRPGVVGSLAASVTASVLVVLGGLSISSLGVRGGAPILAAALVGAAAGALAAGAARAGRAGVRGRAGAAVLAGAGLGAALVALVTAPAPWPAGSDGPGAVVGGLVAAVGAIGAVIGSVIGNEIGSVTRNEIGPERPAFRALPATVTGTVPILLAGPVAYVAGRLVAG